MRETGLYIRVDVSQVPPIVAVHEQDDFTRFHVVVAEADHTWVHPDAVAELADRQGDAEWREKLAGMVRFAESKGWTDDQGRIRAHVEVEKSQEGAEESHRRAAGRSSSARS
jgi:hypothetical protein